MFTLRHSATIRAALAYWRDEMSGHGFEAMRPYFDADVEPLDATEIELLRRQFLPLRIRFMRFAESADAPLTVEPNSVLLLHPPGGSYAVVLLPTRE